MKRRTKSGSGKSRRTRFPLIFLLTIILCLGGLGEFSHAATYYVDFDSGNDSNAGTSASAPWKHAPGDLNATGVPAERGYYHNPLQPGDNIWLKGGVVYRGTITIDGRWTNGTAGSLIIFKGDAWGTGKAILDGSDPLPSNFTRCASASDCGGNPNWQNIYYQDFPGKTYTYDQGFYEDDNFLWYAQDPNPTDPFYFDSISFMRVIPQNDPAIKYTRTSVTDPRYFRQSDPNYWNGAYIDAWYIPNETHANKVTSFDPTTATIYHEDSGGDIYADRDSYYSVLNHVSLIDTPGEFSFDEARQRLYVWPRQNTISHSYSVRNASLITGIFGDSASNIVIEGFIVQRYALGIRAINNSGNGTPQNVTIRNNEIKYLKANDWYALQVGGNSILVENNLVHDDQRAVGILAGGDGVTIKNNTVQRTSRQGIWFMGASSSQILNNTVSDIKGSHSNGISVYSGCNNITVAGNKISNVNSPLTFETSSNLTFYNNIITGTGSDNVNDWGGCTGTVKIFNNVMVKNDRNASLNLGSTGATYIVKNNIIDGGGTGTHENNIYTGLSWSQDSSYGWSLGPGEFVETDLTKIFVDPDNNDYRLKEGSVAIDKGATLTEFSNDYAGRIRPQGTAWDIGAYEYVPGGDTTPPSPPTELRVN